MKITYLRTKGFRKFEDTFETEIYDITEITGGNAKVSSNFLNPFVLKYVIFIAFPHFHI